MRSGGVVALARDVSSAVAGRIVAELSAVGSLLIPASSMSTYDGEEEEAMLDRILSIRYLFDLHGQLDAARHLHLGRIARHPLALAQAAWRLLPTLLDIVTCIPFYAVGGFSVSHLLCEYEFDRDCCRPRGGVMAHSGHLHIITLMACCQRQFAMDTCHRRPRDSQRLEQQHDWCGSTSLRRFYSLQRRS